MSPIISWRDKVIWIIGVDTKVPVETEAEAQQKVEQAWSQTDAMTEALNNKTVSFDQKLFEKHLWDLNKQWSEYNTDFEKNKDEIYNLHYV